MKLSLTSLNSLERLIAFVESNSIRFETVIDILLRYIDDRLVIHLKSIDALTPQQQQNIRELSGTANSFWKGSASYEMAKQARFLAWDLYDKAQHAYRNTLRLLIACLFDEADAEIDTYGLEPLLEVIYSELFEIDASCCEDFEAFFTASLREC